MDGVMSDLEEKHPQPVNAAKTTAGTVVPRLARPDPDAEMSSSSSCSSQPDVGQHQTTNVSKSSRS